MYIVRFIRKDNNADEFYFYSKATDALYHIKFFSNDTSGLYTKIQLIYEEDKPIVVTEINF